jgi:myo-inositol-1-phosphate synthase
VVLYAYAALLEGIPFANGTPYPTADIPALVKLAIDQGVPICDKDVKTGQTLIKTALAPMLKARMLGLNGWYSTNFLGTRDGEVLDDPESFKTKEESKLSVLERILQPRLYPELYSEVFHKVRINCYPPHGDTKRAGTTSISSVGSATPCRSRSTSSAAIRFSPRPWFLTSLCSSTSPSELA